MIERRLRTFLEEESIIEKEQEGFQRGKNTLRSLYRLDLECEWARTHEESAALLNVDIEKAFDSVWLDGLIYKLKNLKINGKMLKMIDVFLRSRKGKIHLDPYTSPLFGIFIGLPQGSVLSPVLFIIFISDFLSNSLKCLKVADDSSVLLSGQKISKSLKDTCSDLEMWCRRWRMAVKGSKTKILPLTNSHEDFNQIKLNGENCKTNETTKSFGLNIDSKLNYKEHTEISVAKATRKRNWHILRKHFNSKWGITIPIIVYLYRSVIQPQVLYGAPIWAQKNIKSLQLFQNNILRLIFKNCLSPPISTAEALTGIPPIDLFCQSLAVKFLFKTKQKTTQFKQPTTKH